MDNTITYQTETSRVNRKGETRVYKYTRVYQRRNGKRGVKKTLKGRILSDMKNPEKQPSLDSLVELWNYFFEQKMTPQQKRDELLRKRCMGIMRKINKTDLRLEEIASIIYNDSGNTLSNDALGDKSSESMVETS